MKAADRYRDLVVEIARTQAFWVLSRSDEDAWATYSDPRGHVVLPVWPTRADAKRLATGDWRDLVRVKVKLDEFLEHELAGLQADGVHIAAHPTTNSSGAVVRVAHFARALGGARHG